MYQYSNRKLSFIDDPTLTNHGGDEYRTQGEYDQHDFSIDRFCYSFECS